MLYVLMAGGTPHAGLWAAIVDHFAWRFSAKLGYHTVCHYSG
jgi:hypothetical protein